MNEEFKTAPKKNGERKSINKKPSHRLPREGFFFAFINNFYLCTFETFFSGTAILVILLIIKFDTGLGCS